ncbi:hypothetical protein ACFQV2_08560 [Actinokineospora soli]|uniref:Uncharacterized protein n=1 Tax=Actinokineospora soli TaxID=1048753 RepID=A0ABW2TJR3_9PSEU
MPPAAASNGAVAVRATVVPQAGSVLIGKPRTVILGRVTPRSARVVRTPSARVPVLRVGAKAMSALAGRKPSSRVVAVVRFSAMAASWAPVPWFQVDSTEPDSAMVLDLTVVVPVRVWRWDVIIGLVRMWTVAGADWLPATSTARTSTRYSVSHSRPVSVTPDASPPSTTV